MKTIKLFPILLLLSLLISCGNGENNNLNTINSSSLNDLVEKAILGDNQSNSRLANLIEYDYPINEKYNKLTIDSIKVKGQIYYYVLLEYPNPAYNRFAVYDKNLTLFLMDKSLNGELNFNTLRFDEVLFGSIVESFLSRDIIVKRLSLYRIEKDSISLSFRSYSSLNSPDLLVSQEIESFQKDSVITKISLSEKLKDIARRDTFIYIPDNNKYISKNNTFTKLVINHLNNNNRKSGLPEIVDEKSMLMLLGIKN